MKVYGMEGCDDLRCTIQTAEGAKNPRAGCDIFEAIRKRRYSAALVSMPGTFDPVVDFIQSGGSDPDVLAIKQTLYRVSGIRRSLHPWQLAVEKRKQVSVLVELKARRMKKITLFMKN